MLKKITRPALLTLLTAAASLGLSGCGGVTERASESTVDGETTTAPSGEAAAARGNAFVRFVNASGDDIASNLFVDDLEAFNSVDRGDVTAYAEWPARRWEFNLREGRTAADEPVATNTEPLSEGQHYTVVAHRYGAVPAIEVIHDPLSDPSPGKAKLRVIHVVDGVDEVDVLPAEGDDAIFDGVDFGRASSYEEFEPQSLSLRVHDDDAPDEAMALTMSNVTLEADKIYTIILSGRRGEPMAWIQVEDELGLSSVAAASTN